MAGKLGLIHPVIPPHQNLMFLQLDKYIPISIPAPTSCDWGSKIASWYMRKNDQIGDCAIVTLADFLQVSSTNVGDLIVNPNDSQTVKAYSDVSGFNPVTGANDNGCVMGDVFSYGKRVGLDGVKLIGSAAVNPKQMNSVKWGCSLLSGCAFGWDLPQSAMDQFDQGKPWSYVHNSPNIGGHATLGWGYDKNGVWYIKTWGKEQEVLPDFIANYLTECWVCASPTWIDHDTGLSPVGLKMSSLLVDMALLS